MATLFAHADLAALPEDGRRREFLDEAFFVTPAPGHVHQDVVMRRGGRLFQSVNQSDLVVLGAPLLAVEVCSRSTAPVPMRLTTSDWLGG